MKKWLVPLFLAVVTALIAGCTSVSELIATGLRVELTQIREASDGSVEVAWRINNPNVVGYVVDRVALRILINGELVGTVADQTRVGIAPQSGVDRKSALFLAKPAGGQRLAAAIGQAPVPYRVETTIWLLLLDDKMAKASLTGSGAVPVVRQ